MRAFVKRAGAGGMLGASIALLLVLVWIAGPWLAPYDPMAIDIGARLVAFTAAHPLGADDFGRDILSRLIHGARASATIAFATVVVAVTASFAPGDKEAFTGFDMMAGSVLGILGARGGSQWGTDGGSVGGAVGLQKGQFTLNQSGVPKRVVNALRKAA
mgnify:CR=1 FL=1